MNEQNHGASNTSNTSNPVSLPAKRKRGRPRKDGNLPKTNMEGSSKPVLINSAGNESSSNRTIFQQFESKLNDGNLIGKVISGVIDGRFDDGFFVSVRIGNNGPVGPVLRGVIFEPGKFSPLTSSNDVAPQAKIFQRRDISIPTHGQQNQINEVVGSQSVMKQPGQLSLQQHVAPHQVLTSMPQSCSGSGSSLLLMSHSQSRSSMVPIGNMSNSNTSSATMPEKMMMQQTPRSTFGNQFQSSPPVENLRMVEQDDAMQVYEVSVRSEGLMVDNHEHAKDMVSESSSETRANNVLHQKEMNDQLAQNQDMRSVHFGSNFNCFGTENHMVLESPNRQSSGKQDQNLYYDLHQHVGVGEAQSLAEKYGESGFQRKDQRCQNKLQGINLELHETPVVTQNQYVPQENQYMNPDNEIRRPAEYEMNRSLPNTLHSTSMEPANMEGQHDPGKMVHNDQLGSKNHGIKEAFVPSNSHFLHRELFPQSMEFVTERPKNEIEEDNQTIHSEKPMHESSDNEEVDSKTAERNAREAMPFDLEIAAEETTWPGKTDNQLSNFTACTTELNLIPGNAVLRTETTETNPASHS